MSSITTGVVTCRPNAVFTGTRHNSFPSFTSSPIIPSAVKNNTCSTPATVATTGAAYAIVSS
jgi:hypothetical protein